MSGLEAGGCLAAVVVSHVPGVEPGLSAIPGAYASSEEAGSRAPLTAIPLAQGKGKNPERTLPSEGKGCGKLYKYYYKLITKCKVILIFFYIRSYIRSI